MYICLRRITKLLNHRGWGCRAPLEVFWSTLLLLFEQGHQEPVAQDQVHNIFKEGDSTTSVSNLVPVLSHLQSKKVFCCDILLVFRRILLCFSLWSFSMILPLGTTENSLTPSQHGVPALYCKLLCSWMALSIYWRMELFLPRCRTCQFPLLNLMRFLWAHFSSLSRFLYMAAQMATTFPYFMSSAKMLRVHSAPSSRSLKKKCLKGLDPVLTHEIYHYSLASKWIFCHYSLPSWSSQIL